MDCLREQLEGKKSDDIKIPLCVFYRVGDMKDWVSFIQKRSSLTVTMSRKERNSWCQPVGDEVILSCSPFIDLKFPKVVWSFANLKYNPIVCHFCRVSLHTIYNRNGHALCCYPWLYFCQSVCLRCLDNLRVFELRPYSLSSLHTQSTSHPQRNFHQAVWGYLISYFLWAHNP